MLPFILLAAGLLLIFCEFFLPGGVVGVLGGLVVVASMVVFAMQYDSLPAILIYIFATSALVIVLFRFAIWRITKYGAKSGVYLNADQTGYVASGYDRDAIGKTGVVSTDLRPGGHIKVEGKKRLAISQSGYLTKGEKVIVVDGQGESLIVKKKEEE